MSDTGVITSITPRRPGDELAAAADVDDEVLVVDSAAAFDPFFEVPRFLAIGDDLVPRQYVAVQNDRDAGPLTVTLAEPLEVEYEEGLPVYLWDPTVEADDKRAVWYQAWVQLDDGDEESRPVPATIPHGTIPLAGVYSLVGASVEVLEDDDGEDYVGEVFGRPAVVDPDTLDRPRLDQILGELPGSGPGQTVSTEEPPPTTEGYPENHVWWQVVAGERLSTWSVSSGGTWEPIEVVTQAAIESLSTLNFSTVNASILNMSGGSIFIAQGEAASEPESFSGTSLPGDWTSTKVGPLGSGSPGAAVPGVSVVSSGPSGQSGSALLVDFGAAGLDDSTAMASGEVYTDIGLASNAEISVRFRSALNGTLIQAEDAMLAIRSQDGAAFSGGWDAITLNLIAGSNFIGGRNFNIRTWTNGSSSQLGVVSVTTDPTTHWHRAKFRLLGGQVQAKVWQDGDPEPPTWTTFQATLASAGRASLVWQQYPAISDSRGQDLWLDEFNVTTYATGFTVNEDGSVQAPLFTQRGEVSSGTLVANTTKDVSVTFPTPFGAAPKVVISLVDVANPFNFGVVAVSVTASGFSARFIRASGTAAIVAHWSAGPAD